MTTSTTAAREQARDTDGRFGAQPRVEADGVELAPVAYRASAAALDVRTDLVCMQCGGEAIEDPDGSPGVIVHGHPDGGADHDTDADHVAVPETIASANAYFEEERDSVAHDGLHSTAESFASAVNNRGTEAQRDFLKQMGWNDEDIAGAGYGPSMDEDDHLNLSDAVIDAASRKASQHYNDGDTTTDGLLRSLDPQDAAPAGHPVTEDPVVEQYGEVTADERAFIDEHEVGAHRGESSSHSSSICRACAADESRLVEAAEHYRKH